MPRTKRALISVYDKTGIVDFARKLQHAGCEIISTGGTARHLNENNIETISISEITGFPEILDGRVKTLHPAIYGGLLALRENDSHLKQLEKHQIGLIDFVVVNLYPFEQVTSDKTCTMAQAVENIDIGGPCMIRAAAKNFKHVAVITSPDQYEKVAAELHASGALSLEMRHSLAVSAFRRTSSYDAAIQKYFTDDSSSSELFPESMVVELEKVQKLRYGENPHQGAAVYRVNKGLPESGMDFKQLHGKELSYNNLMDLDAAIGIAFSFSEPCVAVIKHTNPCGVAVFSALSEAYRNARATDPVSSFGGIVGLNRIVDAKTAAAISEIFTEVVVAPGFKPEALEVLTKKKNIRLIESGDGQNISRGYDIRKVQGSLLLQDQDLFDFNDIDFKVVSKRQPDEHEWSAMKFGWRVIKWVKSNAIVYCAENRTIGIGAGQMSRIDSSKIAVDKARRMELDLTGTAMASDAFFPFRDGIDEAAKAGATAVIQPGGSIRDEEVIQAADEHKMAMVFTGIRHFRH